MRSFILSSVILLLGINICLSQSSGTITGKITSTEGNPLPAININIAGTHLGTTTNEKGKYLLSNIPAGTHTIVVTSVGYKRKEKKIKVPAKDTLDLSMTLQRGVVGLNKVVVSATRGEKRLEEVPASVTIIEAAEIDNQMNIHHNMNDILSQTVPGMAQSTKSASNFGQNLRGRPTLVMIDGIPQSTPLRDGERDLRTIDPSIIERVEVVKGATALYGHGATGGFINYITDAPQSEEIHSQTTLNTNGSLTYPDSTLGYRLSQQFSGKAGPVDFLISGTYENYGLRKDANGNVIPPNPQSQGGLPLSETINAFGKVGYDINAQHRLQLMYNFYSSQQPNRFRQIRGKIGEYPAQAVRRDSTIGVPSGTRANHNVGLTYRGEDIFTNTDIKAQLYHQNFETVYSYTSYFKGGGQTMITSKKYGGRLQLNTSLSWLDQLGTDLTYGIDILNDITAQPLVDGRTSAPPMNLLTGAPFLQTHTSWGEHWHLKAGIRWEQATISVDDYKRVKQLNAVTGKYTVGGNKVKGGQLNYNALTYNAGLSFTKWNAFSPFASYSRGFSLADLGRTLSSAQENTLQKLKTEPILVDNYELGIRSAFETIQLEVNAFMSNSELGSSYQQRDDGSFGIVRSPEIVYGYELSASIQPIRDMQLDFTYTFTEGKRDVNDNNSFEDPVDDYLPGSRIAPPKFTQSLKYKVTPHWKVGMSALYSQERDRFPNSSSFGRGTVEEYFVADFYTSYQWKMLTVKAGVENIFNTDYYPPVSQWYNLAGFGYAKAPGRRINLTLQIDL